MIAVDDRVRRVPAMTEVGQLDAIDRLHELFGRHEIDSWLFGGWAVDFHARSITRTHEDIDIAVWKADLDVLTCAQPGWREARHAIR
jgi:aminoglycoside-2''-adenylyltransferase